MLAKFTLSPRSIFEILGIYSLMLGFQSLGLFIMGVNPDWNLYLHKSFLILHPENYRAICALIYVFMTVSIWIYCKIQHRIFNRVVVLSFLQMTINIFLHYLFLVEANMYFTFYVSLFLDIIVLINIIEMLKKSFFAAFLMVPHLFWSSFLMIVSYQNL